MGVFKQGVLFHDNPPELGVVVLGINCQGIIDFSEGLKQLKKKAPKVYNSYIQMCLNNKLSAGDIACFRHENYDIVLAVLAEHVVGKHKDPIEVVLLNFQDSLDKILAKYGRNEIYISDIMARPFDITGALFSEITFRKLNWTFYRD